MLFMTLKVLIMLKALTMYYLVYYSEIRRQVTKLIEIAELMDSLE